MNGYWIPLVIFICCVVNVTLNTMKMYYIATGSKTKAIVFAVMHAIVWMLAISTVISNLDNWMCYIAWSCGQGLGVWIGMSLAKRLQKDEISALSITPFGYYFMNNEE